MKQIFLLFIVICCSFLSAQSEPIIVSLLEEGHNFGETELEKENELNIQATFQRLEDEGHFFYDHDLNGYIYDLLQELSNNILDEGLQLEIFILKEQGFYHEVLTDGRVLLSMGLLANLETRGELAFVLAQALAKHIYRHALRKLRLEQQNIFNLPPDADGSRLADGYGLLADFSVDLINESDTLAIKIMKESGFGPKWAIDYLQKYPRKVPGEFKFRALTSIAKVRYLNNYTPYIEERLRAIRHFLTENNYIETTEKTTLIEMELSNLRWALLDQMSWQADYLTAPALDSLEKRLITADKCLQEFARLARAESYLYLLQRRDHLAYYQLYLEEPGKLYSKILGRNAYRRARETVGVDFENYIYSFSDLSTIECEELRPRYARVIGLAKFRYSESREFALDMLRQSLVEHRKYFSIWGLKDEEYIESILSEANGQENEDEIRACIYLTVDFELNRFKAEDRMIYRGDYPYLENNEIINESDFRYDVIYNEELYRLFLDKFNNHTNLSELPIFGPRDISSENRWLLFNGLSQARLNRSKMWLNNSLVIGGLKSEDKPNLRPELYNFLNDSLNIDYIFFLNIKVSQDFTRENLRSGLAEKPLVQVHCKALIVDALTGELVEIKRNSCSITGWYPTFSGITHKELNPDRFNGYIERYLNHFSKELVKIDLIED